MDLDRILFQKALACQVGQPFAGRDKGHIFHAGKCFALALKVFADRTHYEASRVSAKLRAVRTMALPLLAFYHGKVRTMACESPAVVQRPFHLHFRMFFDPSKQHFYIDVVAVKVVQPQQVGLVFLGPLQELFGRMFRTKPMCIK